MNTIIKSGAASPPLFGAKITALLRGCGLLSVVVVVLFVNPCSSRTKVHLHAVIPHHFTASRDFESAFFPSFVQFKRNRGFSKVFEVFNTSGNLTFLRFDEPLEILRTFCSDILGSNTVTLINVNNPELMGKRPDANTYILELAQTLGLPVISWDAEFSGSPKHPEDSLALQIAPTIQHQARAIFSLLQRYNWTQFSVVTTQVAGYQQFLASLQTIARHSQKNARITVSGTNRKSFTILREVLISDWKNVTKVRYELNTLSGTDTRIIVLHSRSGGECYTIMETAAVLGLTGRNYQWILTQTAITKSIRANKAFPIGTLGLTYDHDSDAMKRALKTAVKVWFTALLEMSQKPADLNNIITFPTPKACNRSDADLRWKDGKTMYSYLQNIRIPREPQLRFDANGTLRQTELIIINCRWDENIANQKKWQKVGRWMRHGLVMNDIVWPGGSSIPPSGMPARSFLRIATLAEMPYVIYVNPGPHGECMDHAVHCRIYERDDNKQRLSNTTIPMCCVGLSIDLLRVFSRELRFDYDLFEVEDGMWGAIDKATGNWNGPIKMLIEHEADMVVTSLKINPDRSRAVRFSIPFLETGITIVVSLREGAISPTAFLEPYDYPSWCLILVFSVHTTGASIFIFEWLSPYGLNRGKTFYPDHKFSLFRSFWMIWAMLFSAAVDTDGPKGVSSRFLANIWALFALVFLASYTANLAAFMITKEEYYDLSGIQDWRLQNPTHTKPPFKYATVPEGSTETNIRNNHPAMYNYMKPYNKPDVGMGIEAVKKGEIQAFIYDATVLEYYVGKDTGCRLRTVGNWYAMTGYGVAFPPGENNPWIDKVNRVIFQLLENGEMERLQKFWLAGACYFEKDKKGVSNKTLGILNFTSAFILLGGGVLLSVMLLVLEFLYFRFGRRCLRKFSGCRCCSLISLSLGQTLTMEETVRGTVERKKRCRDQVCDTQIWRLRHQLDLALLKIENLQNQISCGAAGNTEPDITRQITYQDSDYSQYNGAARRHTAQNIYAESERLLGDDTCDSRSEGGGTRLMRRSPSYTSAVGGDLLSDAQKQSNKSRHHEGKMYVGVDSSANSSESVL